MPAEEATPNAPGSDSDSGAPPPAPIGLSVGFGGAPAQGN
jgi:hypothetical protein